VRFKLGVFFYFVGGAIFGHGRIKNLKESKKKYKIVGFEVFYRISLKKK